MGSEMCIRDSFYMDMLYHLKHRIASENLDVLTDFINHGIVEQNQAVPSETIHATMTGDMLGKLMSLFFSEFCSQANKAAFQNDLLRLESLEKLRDQLIKKVMDLTICDSFDMEDVESNHDWQTLLKFSNPKYWVAMNKNSTYYRRKKKFEELMDKYGLDSLKRELVQKVERKSFDLISTANEMAKNYSNV